jgi:beta-glucanase (GH16 family)
MRRTRMHAMFPFMHPRSPLRLAFVPLLLALLASGCAELGIARHHPPGLPGWSLDFDDEFDHAGAPDPAKWTPELGYVRNEEAQYYTARPENVRVENGMLVIEAHKERYQGFSYTSASITTFDHRQFLYGRVEVRAKLPAGLGTWPAIWLLGADINQVGWPACGEIDIMENVGHEPLRIYGTVHTPAYNHTLKTSKGGTIEIESPSDGFHVYGVEWSPDRVDFFVDERRYFTFQNERRGNAVWPFDKPQYLILNLAIGGDWGGERGIDDQLFPHRSLIDYVRVYRRLDAVGQQ